MVLSSGNKTGSVPDIVPVSADTLDDFKTVTRDVSQIPNIVGDPTLARLKARFAQSSLGSVLLDKNLGNATGYQLDTLAVGLAELSQAQAEIANMDKFFGETNTKALLEGCAEKDIALKTLGYGGALFPPPNPFREKLKLAGIMAKTGLANGMTISLNRGFEDTHVGGAEVGTARNAASYWLLIAEFWQWVKSAKLQDDVMIVITHDFTRTAYNGYKSSSAEVTDLSGKKVNVVTPGRDHALAMGMMFINGKVPRSARVGVVTDNIAPVAGKDTKGGIDLNAQPYLSHNIIGSMLMRVYDDLYPTERMVRKHWPTFQEIPLLSAI
ncbi:MAG: hypothetical protein EOP14_06860 [Pseudomonas sp.]|nr:MAG: hypothetical protein EOP14_06860 [Pseudomonas sp.]